MVWRSLAKGFLSGVGSSYGRGFVKRLTHRYGGRKRAPYTTRRGRVMRGTFTRRRAKRGTYRREHLSRMAVEYYTPQTVVHAGNPAAPIFLCDIDQGVADSQRVGNSVVITKLKGKFFFNWNSVEIAQLLTGVRVMISYHPQKLPLAVNPLLTDMLVNIPTADISQFKRNRDVPGDETFKIVYDRVFYLHKYPTNVVNGLWSQGANHHTIRINLKPKTRLTYHGAAGTDFGAGCYFMWFFTSENLTLDPQVTGSLRLWWKDV